MKFVVELSGPETIESIERGTLLSLIKSVSEVTGGGNDSLPRKDEPEPAPEPVQKPIPAPVPAPEPVPTSAPVPTKPVSYTLDDLQKAAIGLMDDGHKEDLITLLGKFEVPSLVVLPEEKYGEFALALREIGAEI